MIVNPGGMSVKVCAMVADMAVACRGWQHPTSMSDTRLSGHLYLAPAAKTQDEAGDSAKANSILRL